MNFKNIVIACVVSFGFPGCATITSSELQSLTLSTTTTDGKAIDKVRCTLKNDKGAWELVSPGTVAVQRSAEDLMVECRKEGVADGFLIATSRIVGSMLFGNVLSHGIGVGIDHYTGKGYDYPSNLPIAMGKSVTVDKRQEQQPASAGSSVVVSTREALAYE